MKVQVLLATYNGDKFLSEFLQSLFSQTYKDFELLIQDDCSKDNTVNILEEWSKKYSQISIFKNSKNLGYYENFHLLLQKADGDIIFFADQDDVWISNKLERAIDIFVNEKEIVLYYSELDLYDEKMNSMNMTLSQCLKFDPNKNATKELLNRNVVTGCTTALKREALQGILPFPNGLRYHDWWIALCASIKGKLYFDNYSTVYYRQHGNNSIGINGLSYDPTFLQKLKDFYNDILFKKNIIIELEKRFHEKEYEKKIKKVRLSIFQNFFLLITSIYKKSRARWFKNIVYGRDFKSEDHDYK